MRFAQDVSKWRVIRFKTPCFIHKGSKQGVFFAVCFGLLEKMLISEAVHMIVI